MKCDICPRHCDIPEGGAGFCRARANVNGAITCANYGRLTSLALDPIEKKPLTRFHPGTMILSAGSYGCNLRCPYCQNSSISMADESTNYAYTSPESLVKMAVELVPRGNIGIAFTYNEPLISFEYVKDCSILLHEHGLFSVLVTNGYISEAPFMELLDYVDAMNIDLKGFSQKFYDWIGGKLETVKRNIEIAAGRCHVELTTLVIPGENDDTDEMNALAAWVASIDPEIPLHISRFFPRYKVLDLPPTHVSTIRTLRDVAQKHLKYVYMGNC